MYKRFKSGFVLIYVLLFVLIASVSGYFLLNKQFKKKADFKNTTKQITYTTSAITEKPAADPEEISVKSNPKYSIRLPLGMETDEAKSNSGSVTIQTESEIRREYAKYKEDGCPGACGTIIEGDNLEKQFQILKEIGSLDNCNANEEIKNKIESFMLFDGGISSKDIVDTIHNDNLKSCGIKLIGADGYDVSIYNLEYEVGLTTGDKVVRIRFPLMNRKVFKEVDKLFGSWGYIGNECDAKCYENEAKYFEEIDYNSQLIQTIINTYDSSVKSFKLL